jgi:hypothetical protein
MWLHTVRLPIRPTHSCAPFHQLTPTLGLVYRCSPPSAKPLRPLSPPLTRPTPPPRSSLPPTSSPGVILSTRPSFYRLAIWTRFCPGPESEAATDDLLKRITMIGKHFKTAVLGFGEDEALAGGYSTEVEWISHSDSEKKDKKVSVSCRLRRGRVAVVVVFACWTGSVSQAVHQVAHKLTCSPPSSHLPQSARKIIA